MKVEKEKEIYIMVERIMELTSENLNIDRALIQPTSSFKGDLGIDSLDLFELVMALEEEFDVEIPTEDLEKLSTVQDVADYVEAHRA
ncbi:MAG: acyl carrier protein [Lachnospiraceae bacterium]|nr:acyl carrier protein [Lachnospiraceae bacterium]